MQSVTLRKNTFMTTFSLEWNLLQPAESARTSAQVEKAFHIEAEENIFRGGVNLNQGALFQAKGRVLPAQEAEAWLQKAVDWQEQRNLYPGGPEANLLRFSLERKRLPESRNVGTLTEWQQFWKLGTTNSLQGQALIQGGNLLTRAATAPLQVEPQDFRLLATSPGHHADRKGQDLGADVSLVGPGAPYAHWKGTAGYQEWMKKLARVLPTLQPRWNQLFNGKDLQGWRIHPKQPGAWKVENGVLSGAGQADCFLLSERGDYDYFILRLEACLVGPGEADVLLPFPEADLPEPGQVLAANKVLFSNDAGSLSHRSGSLFCPVPTPAGVLGQQKPAARQSWMIARSNVKPPAAGQWFSLEMAVGKKDTQIKLNGQMAVNRPTNRLTGHSPGHLALQVRGPDTWLQVRKMEIRGAEPHQSAANSPP